MLFVIQSLHKVITDVIQESEDNDNISSRYARVTVIGLGYIGLPTAAILASRKIDVVGVDICEDVVRKINCGEVHIVEPELDIIVRAVVSQGKLRATLQPEPADVFLIAVPTPLKDNNVPDLSYIREASIAIAPFLKKDDLVILESTSPVGTTEQLSRWLSEARNDLIFPHQDSENFDIKIAYCPERVLPGRAIQELVHNDRIIGGITPKCAAAARDLYGMFVEGECFITDSRTAEMSKLAENSFRDVNIAFANELSIICDKFGIDPWNLIHLANRHPRVNILNPGPGVGGHCIAVDPWFIISQLPQEARMMRTARSVNEGKPAWVLNKLKDAVGEFLQDYPQKNIEDVVISCCGLAFKADIDDLRESPALEITKSVVENHAGRVLVVEPNISELPPALLGKSTLKPFEQALIESDVVLMLVAHKSFVGIRNKVRKGTKIVDTIGVLS